MEYSIDGKATNICRNIYYLWAELSTNILELTWKNANFHECRSSVRVISTTRQLTPSRLTDSEWQLAFMLVAFKSTRIVPLCPEQALITRYLRGCSLSVHTVRSGKRCDKNEHKKRTSKRRKTYSSWSYCFQQSQLAETTLLTSRCDEIRSCYVAWMHKIAFQHEFHDGPSIYLHIGHQFTWRLRPVFF